MIVRILTEEEEAITDIDNVCTRSKFSTLFLLVSTEPEKKLTAVNRSSISSSKPPWRVFKKRAQHKTPTTLSFSSLDLVKCNFSQSPGFKMGAWRNLAAKLEGQGRRNPTLYPLDLVWPWSWSKEAAGFTPQGSHILWLWVPYRSKCPSEAGPD